MVFADAESIITENLKYLRPVAESWQPSDFLPVSSADSWHDEVRALRERAKALPDGVLVVLVGNLVTEEALPSYQTWLNRPDGLEDATGAAENPWAVWTRGWTAEENRHGDLLNRYLYLSGRVDMRSTEITTQHLIRNGFDTGSGKDPYKALVYVSFQERATKISHANTGKLAGSYGETVLERICATIAGDEARHEEAYKRIFAKVLENEPGRALTAFAEMMRLKIAMPARRMDDGGDGDVFSNFAVVAQRLEVYTMRDYADIIAHLVDFWRVGHCKVSGEAARAQDYVCGLSEKYAAKAERFQEIARELPAEPFNWIFRRQV